MTKSSDAWISPGDLYTYRITATQMNPELERIREQFNAQINQPMTAWTFNHTITTVPVRILNNYDLIESVIDDDNQTNTR